MVRLPESVSFADGSVLANAIGTPFHALVKRMDLRPGERVVITGAGGGVGLHAVQIATLVGAHVLAVDMTRAKLDAATSWGAEETVDTTTDDLRAAVADRTGGRGADAVLELVGPATMRDTLPSLAKGVHPRPDAAVRQRVGGTGLAQLRQGGPA